MDGPMVRYGAREIPHDELRLQAARVAAGLSEAGVRHGDRVALVLRNDPTFLALSAACGLMGAVPVPVNWHWHGHELRHVITHSESRAVFAHSDFVTNVEEVLPEGVPLVEVPVPAELTAHYGPAPVTGRRPLFAEWIGAHEPYAQPLDAAPMSLIYTSGTTGLPKGVIRDAMAPEQSREVAAATLARDGPPARDAHAGDRADVPLRAQCAGAVRAGAGHRAHGDAALCARGVPAHGGR